LLIGQIATGIRKIPWKNSSFSGAVATDCDAQGAARNPNETDLAFAKTILARYVSRGTSNDDVPRGGQRARVLRGGEQKRVLEMTREEMDQEFREMVKSIRCPVCDLHFTDFAAEWGLAWMEGRRDRQREEQRLLEPERDGPQKLKCELCLLKFWLSPFGPSATVAHSGETYDDSIARISK
jgi:hypothetical protein